MVRTIGGPQAVVGARGVIANVYLLVFSESDSLPRGS